MFQAFMALTLLLQVAFVVFSVWFWAPVYSIATCARFALWCNLR